MVDLAFQDDKEKPFLRCMMEERCVCMCHSIGILNWIKHSGILKKITRENPVSWSDSDMRIMEYSRWISDFEI